MKRWVIVVFILGILFFSSHVLALGISPAIVDVDFNPKGEYEFTFSISSDDPEQPIEVSLAGPLAKYASVSKEEVIGSGTFDVRLKLPSEIETPGPNRISVIISEKKPEGDFIGTKIEIRGTIIVHVPYPGRYVEAEFNIGDGNVDSFIPLFLRLENKGDESIYVSSEVGIFDDKGNSIYNIPFSPLELEKGGSKNFKKIFNTTNVKPGDYLAKAFVNYGDKINIEKNFRIGYIFVEVTNFTDSLMQNGIQKFFVDVESKWNGDIEAVYADVNLSNSTKEIIFRTPSISLAPWGKGILEGFVDTSQLEGEYNANIKLSYSGKETMASGKLYVYKREFNLAFVLGIVIFVILSIIFMIWLIIKKRRNKKGKKR